MALRDPISAYNAETNHEAHFVRLVLEQGGVEAFVMEDLSPVGIWMFGLLPEIHKPQVWIERSDIERAKPLLVKYEQERSERPNPTTQEDTKPIEVVCEECGKPSLFTASNRSTIQDCPQCGAYVDVPGGNDEYDWSEAEKAPDE